MVFIISCKLSTTIKEKKFHKCLKITLMNKKNSLTLRWTKAGWGLQTFIYCFLEIFKIKDFWTLHRQLRVFFDFFFSFYDALFTIMSIQCCIVTIIYCHYLYYNNCILFLATSAWYRIWCKLNFRNYDLS